MPNGSLIANEPLTGGPGLLVAAVCLLFGGFLSAHALRREHRSETRFEAESQRAKSEWDELLRAAAAARRAGASVESIVRSRGNRVDGVVRWVVHDLEDQTRPR
jgi:hypothetical protein